MTKKMAAALAAVVAWGTASGSAAAAETTVGVGADYSTGDYGEDEDTDIWFVPVTAKYQTENWILKMTVPYIRITGPSDVLPDVGRVGEPTTVSRTEEGLGDVVLSATRTAYASSNLLIDLTAKAKLATADEDKGLGTGEHDYTLQVDTYAPVGESTVFGTVGYRVMGDSSQFELDNVWLASVGFSHPVTEKTSAGAIADWREATSSRGDPRRELTVFATHKLTPDWSLQGYAVKGFSDGSPDWAAGAVILRSF